MSGGILPWVISAHPQRRSQAPNRTEDGNSEVGEDEARG